MEKNPSASNLQSNLPSGYWFRCSTSERKETRRKAEKNRLLRTTSRTPDLPITSSGAPPPSERRLRESRQKSECSELAVETATF